MWSSSGLRLGMVGALVGAAALLAREAGRTDQARERIGVVLEMGQAFGARRSPANSHSAARVSSVGGSAIALSAVENGT